MASKVKKPSPEGVELLRSLIFLMGDNPFRTGLLGTPNRVLRSWKEIFAGYKQNPKAILKANFYEDGYDEMILSKDIAFTSVCEHHLLPFVGVAHVAYLPNLHVVGISKLSRLVDCYSRRLQIQERLTVQIAQSLMTYVKPKGVGVIIEAKHSCMACRGVRKQESIMVTSKLVGAFRDDPATRSEFNSRV